MTSQFFKTKLLPWHKDSIMFVRQALQQEKCTHSWLVVGSEGIGKYNFALHFSNILLCQANTHSQKPCGFCKGCLLFETGNHPDFKLVEVAGSSTIKIEIIREIGESVVQTANQGRNKVVMIRDAEKMNISAANAFLKTLEEPPPHTFLILVSSRANAILPTILSRCQKITIPTPFHSEALHWLATQNVDEKMGKFLLRLSQRSPLKALEWNLHPESLKLRLDIFEGLEKLSKQMVFPIQLAKEWSGGDLSCVFYWLEIIVMDIVRCCYSISTSFFVNVDKVEHLKIFVQTSKTDKRFWLDYLKKIQHIKDACQRIAGLNKLLLLENLLILWWKRVLS